MTRRIHALALLVVGILTVACGMVQGVTSQPQGDPVAGAVQTAVAASDALSVVLPTIEAAHVTPSATATATPVPATATRTATVAHVSPTAPAATATRTPRTTASATGAVTASSVPASATLPPATATLAATASLTPTLSVTFTPEATATPVPTQTGAHNTSTWHAALDFHHHGADPFGPAVHPAIQVFLLDHPLFLQVGHPWESSPAENLYPWPMGKHEGWKLLAETNTSCDQFDPGGQFPHDNCIMAYALWVHDLATAHEARTPIHSWKGVFLVCDDDDTSVCDIVASGGWQRFGGELHPQYKKTVCNAPGFQIYPPGQTADQPPYTAFRTRTSGLLFWSGLVNALMEGILTPPVPNRLLNMAFMSRPWSAVSQDVEHCADPAHDIIFCPEGDCRQRADEFSVFTLLLDIEGYTQRPYAGYVDRQGALNMACAAPGANCIPLIIGAGVPQGNATLNRSVQNDTHVQDFDPTDEMDLRMPGH